MECIAYWVHFFSPYKDPDKQSHKQKSSKRESFICGQGAPGHTRVSLQHHLFVPPSRVTAASRRSCVLMGQPTAGTSEERVLWVNTWERGEATFAWIIKFSVLQTEYELAPPIVTNEGCLSENRRADSQRGLVGRPQPRPRPHSSSTKPIHQFRTTICH